MSVAKKGARLGVAAFALGLSLAGPQVAGIASADSPDTAGAESAGPDNAQQAPARQSRPARSARTQRAAATPAPAAAADRTETLTPADRAPRPAASRTRGARTEAAALGAAARRPAASRTAATPVLIDRTLTSAVPAAQPTVAVDTTTSPVEPAASSAPSLGSAIKTLAEQVVTTLAQPAPAAATLASLSIPTGHVAAGAITDIFTAIFAPIQSFIDGIGLLIRRTFFNQAPTVNPIQTTGLVDGTISGTLNAVDPEGDPLTFRLVASPSHGSVQFGTDGTYAYTPADGYTGIDSFNVAVADGGFHINLFDLFRPSSTEAYVQVAPNADVPALTFNFIYGSGSQFWSPAARSALQSAALQLAGYFVVTTPTTITYDVTGESSALSTTLASAGSDLTGGGGGFFATVVQEKIQTGTDTNGTNADGQISWNFGRSWAFGSSVASGQYDFTSTAMHELLHTFGFLSNIDAPGNNIGTSWTTFDKYIVTGAGDHVISPTTFAWLTQFNSSLVGSNGGLLFAGPNAVAVYGQAVPLFTPGTWQSGSSVSHLNDSTFTGANDKMMNATTSTGLGIRVLSPVELAILKDLGYNVTDTPVYAVVFLGLGLLRRPRRNTARR